MSNLTTSEISKLKTDLDSKITTVINSYKPMQESVKKIQSYIKGVPVDEDRTYAVHARYNDLAELLSTAQGQLTKLKSALDGNLNSYISQAKADAQKTYQEVTVNVDQFKEISDAIAKYTF